MNMPGQAAGRRAAAQAAAAAAAFRPRRRLGVGLRGARYLLSRGAHIPHCRPESEAGPSQALAHGSGLPLPLPAVTTVSALGPLQWAEWRLPGAGASGDASGRLRLQFPATVALRLVAG